jgi:hypothetical protein
VAKELGVDTGALGRVVRHLASLGVFTVLGADISHKETILRGIRNAASPESTLLVFEFIIPDDAGEFEASDIDVAMLALVTGRERTLPEYVALLERAGWRFTRVGGHRLSDDRRSRPGRHLTNSQGDCGMAPAVGGEA